MRVLGICHDVLICSAALVEDGVVVSAVAEERLDRVKRSRVFPQRAIDACLAQAGVDLGQVDEVAVAWNPGIELETVPQGYLDARRWRVEHLHQVPGRLLRRAGARAGAELTQTGLFPGCPPVTYLDHYLAHVGNAAFLSPWEECAVLVLDGRGERQTALLGRVSGVELERLEEVHFPHSLGLFYGAVTQHLGFRPDADEWKVMALASYGRREGNPWLDPLRRLIRVDERGRFALELGAFAFFDFWDRRMVSDRFEETFGPPRAPDAPLEGRHRDLAAAMQVVFEECAREVLLALHRRTGLPRVALSGGCMMNGVHNGKVTATTPFAEVFVSSCPDDSGTSVGAALFLCAQRTGRRGPLDAPAHRHDFWGPGYTDEECRAAVARCKLAGERVADPARRAAEDLAAGRLVGWFQGRAEFGQRALGNRSILADPRRAETRDLVNAAVKFREGFRPFAPAVLAERAADYFECPPDLRLPFMQEVRATRAERAAEIPAVVHVDGSARLQTVARDHASPRFRALLEAFAERTGVPVVLNTSFNVDGEPIVQTPTDALRTFHSCGLDVLYLGDVRLAK